MTELPKRKPIRLKEYSYSENGLYHIVICTKDNKKILSQIIETDDFHLPQVKLTRYGKIAEKYILSSNRIDGITVDEYVIMPDHIHMILILDRSFGKSRAPCPTADGSFRRANEIIPHTVSTLKRFVNREIGENIFQSRYFDRVIRNHKEYSETKEYIRNNPVNRIYDKYH